MNDEIDKAVKILLAKIASDSKADDVLKVTQAVLNLAHAKATYANC